MYLIFVADFIYLSRERYLFRQIFLVLLSGTETSVLLSRQIRVLLVCGLLNDAFSTSGYIVSNGTDN
jgi:hypothetical protein